LKVLLIGYGSIGKRHEEVLSKVLSIKHIDIVTKQKLAHKNTFLSMKEISDLNYYDYFIISSETNKHYGQLKYLENQVQDKIIFCEKPLFNKKEDLNIKNNQVYIGYVLRFHPLFQKLKELLVDEKIININVKCGQYLPTWRPDTNYRTSYSAFKEEGGGVLLDLSHEIDYVQWLVGKLINIKSYQVKVSDLEINSDDLTMILAKTDEGDCVNISIDYISKITHRNVLIDTFNCSYNLDLINNKLIQKCKDTQKIIFENIVLERNDMFEKMHLSIFKRDNISCTYNEALSVMDTINIIQGQNNE
jgi:CMP-N,N'-diacetyllegionaminic acid synthase